MLRQRGAARQNEMVLGLSGGRRGKVMDGYLPTLLQVLFTPFFRNTVICWPKGF